MEKLEWFWDRLNKRSPVLLFHYEASLESTIGQMCGAEARYGVMGPAWAHVMGGLPFSRTGSHAPQDHTLDLMLYCHILIGILNNCLKWGPLILFCTGLCKLCSSLACESTNLLGNISIQHTNFQWGQCFGFFLFFAFGLVLFSFRNSGMLKLTGWGEMKLWKQ